VSAEGIAKDIRERAEAVENNYIKVDSSTSKMYLGKTGTEEIIFDCGGAPI
jgi:hypothetical protein